MQLIMKLPLVHISGADKLENQSHYLHCATVAESQDADTNTDTDTDDINRYK